jgi:two-component system sensor histidine kinase DctS
MFDRAKATYPTTLGLALSWARRSLWLLPLLASLLFVVSVLIWAYRGELEEQEARRATMIADALSSEAQLQSRLDAEMALLRDLARQLAQQPRTAHSLTDNPIVQQGLRRLWLGVTWLDANNRIVAHVPNQQQLSGLLAKELLDGTGVSSHLLLELGGDKLIVRYAPSLLLRRGLPWWLTRKYDVQLVDGYEQVIASVDEVPLRLDAQGRETYTVLVGDNMPGAYLELISRETTRPVWRALPLVLVGGFLSLMLVVTLLLRRQMQRISRAEGAWRTEAAWRQAMEDSALVGLRARDAEGRILYVNRTFCDMVGFSDAQLVGLQPPMPYWPPDALDETMLRSQRNLEGHAPREGYEALWCHRDGRRLNVMVFESPLIDARGQQSGWMGSIIDITARKKLEERERHQADAMAHQARLTTLGEVASALAHQLNQPLTVIMGYNAGLQRMLTDAGYDNQGVLHALAQQGEQAAEAGRIVRRIREFLTRRAPQREACELGVVARRAAELLQRDLHAAQVHIDWALPTQLPLVFADPILLEQVLINLLRNAADALLGGARDAAQGKAESSLARRIRISAQGVGERFVRMDVEDNGPGLQGLSVEALSAPFYSTKSEGMGMGLAICRSVIEVHHGGMDAGSSSLGGARFSFTLPVFDVRRQDLPLSPGTQDPQDAQAARLADEDARALLEGEG